MGIYLGYQVELNKNINKQLLIEDVLNGNTDDLSYFLSNNNYNANIYDDLGNPLLILAIGRHHYNKTVIEILLNHGANPNCSNYLGITPLIRACDYGYLDITELLVKKGAMINQKDRFSKNTPLMWAIRSKHPLIVNFLIAHGANINESNVDGETPLIYATMTNQPKIVMILLKKGANPYIKDNEGRTALSLAEEYKIIGILKILR